MNRVAAVAVCCTVLLAGCSGVLPGAGGEQPTTTGAPVPTTDTTGAGETTGTDGMATVTATGDLPPGLSSTGLADGTALAKAHDDALSETTYRAVLASDETLTANGSNASSNTRQVVVRGREGRFLTEATVVRGNVTANRTVWGNRSVGVQRQAFGGNVQYTRVQPGKVRSRLSGVQTLSGFLSAGNYSLVEVNEQQGLTFYTLRTETYYGGQRFPSQSNVSSFDSTVLVDERGRIHLLRSTLVVEREDRTRTVEFMFDLKKVGNARAPAPAWLPEGLERTAS